jgi:hypothetical protein
MCILYGSSPAAAISRTEHSTDPRSSSCSTLKGRTWLVGAVGTTQAGEETAQVSFHSCHPAYRSSTPYTAFTASSFALCPLPFALCSLLTAHCSLLTASVETREALVTLVPSPLAVLFMERRICNGLHSRLLVISITSRESFPP